MSDQHLGRIIRAYAEAEVPADKDLWPSIQRRVASRQGRWRASAALRRAAAVGLAATVLFLALTSAAPRARAAIELVLQRFGLVPVATSATPAAPAAGATAFEERHAMVELEQAQRQVPFAIPLPAWLPPGVELRGAVVGEGPYADSASPPVSVTLIYGAASQPDGGLGIQIIAGTGLGAGIAVPAERVEATMVGESPAAYADGTWVGVPGDLRWDPQADAGTLSWEAAGLTYVVSASGLSLDRADLVRIAESLR